jgi:hypothetical protein
MAAEMKLVDNANPQGPALVDILVGANVALGLISARLITILALVMTFGLFIWAMCVPEALRCTIASIWAVVIFLPVLWIGRRGHDRG